MSAIIIAVIALIAFGLAFRPLFQQETFAMVSADEVDSNLEDLLSAREATYSAIKDLESDHAQGKLSDVDYQNLRSKYETKAIAILQQLDLAETSVGVKPQPVTASDSKCPHCGEPFDAKDKFCRRCGASIAPTCASCGETVKVGARFCGRCGAPTHALQPA